MIEYFKKDKLKASVIIASIFLFIVGIIVTAFNTRDTYALSNKCPIAGTANYSQGFCSLVMVEQSFGTYSSGHIFVDADDCRSYINSAGYKYVSFSNGYCNYSSIYYDITLNANGGLYSDGYSSKYYEVYDGNTFKFPSASRGGYVLKGWATSSTATSAEYSAGVTYKPTSDKTFYAIWAQGDKYTITLNANGGTTSSGSSTATHSVSKGESFKFPSVSRLNYILKGWSVSKTATYTDYVVGDSYIPSSNITFYAVWVPSEYTITLDANGGFNSDGLSTSKHSVSNGEYFSFPSASRLGYVLKGWSKSKTSTNAEYSVGYKHIPTEDITYYAIWEQLEEYTVTFNANGGLNTNGSETAKHSVLEGSTVKFPEASRLGYELKGWSTSKTATEPQYLVGNTYTPSGNITFYAVWLQNEYTITLDANGGFNSDGLSTSKHSVSNGENFSFPSASRLGYELKGWSTSKTATEPQYLVGNTYMPSGNITFYAVWGGTGGDGGDDNPVTPTPKTYTIKYNANGGIGTTSNSVHTYDVEKELTANGYTKKGYTFVGWSKTSGGSVEYNDMQKVINLTTESSITLYAVWTANSYTVEYDANRGTGTTASSSHVYDVEKNLTVNGYTREGYTFVGWSDSENGTVLYTDGQNVKNLTSLPNGIFKLYAVWEANSYTIKYNANGGTGTTTSSTHSYDVAKNLTVNGFTRTGYTFAGWSETAGGSVKYTDSQSVINLTKDNNVTINLYAVWNEDGGNINPPEVAITYTIKYNANGGTGIMANSSHTYDVAKNLTANSFTKVGYTFAGWSKSTDGIIEYTDKQSVINLSDVDGTVINLYAVWKANKYSISYELNNGNNKGNPVDAEYDKEIIIDNPTKKVTIVGNDNKMNAIISDNVEVDMVFAGWTSSDIDTQTAYYNDILWSNGNNKVTAISFRNLTSVNNGKVSLVANWLAQEVNLPSVSKLNYTCNWNTKADGSGTSYNSGGKYTVSPDSVSTINLYAICTSNSNPDNDLDNGPQTGDALIYFVWVVGAGALGYSVYYFMKKRNNL